MSTTALTVDLGPNYNLRVALNPQTVYNGTDFSQTLEPNTLIPAGTKDKQVAVIGDPGIAESNHWGWLYFWAIPTNGGERFPMQLYVHESHSDVDNAAVGWYAGNSTANDPMPLGTFGKIDVSKEPPGGKVKYSFE